MLKRIYIMHNNAFDPKELSECIIYALKWRGISISIFYGQFQEYYTLCARTAGKYPSKYAC